MPEYRTIVGVSGDDGLRVRFADGEEVHVNLERLLPHSTAERLRVNEARHNAYEVVIPAAGGDVDISWLDIRAQSDRQFADFLVESAEEDARRIGQRVRTLRQRRGMTARQVADAAGIAPMSLSRIELGRHDVTYRTLRRILAAMNFTLKDLAALDPPELPGGDVVKRLESGGVPRYLAERFKDAFRDRPRKGMRAIERIFGWSESDLADGRQLGLDMAPAMLGRFKAQVNQNPQLAAYTLWAHYLAHLVDQASTRPVAELPENPHAIRDDILNQHGRAQFDGLLQWCWDHGVAVLPLQDPGEFHGACWQFDGGPVIVLKQRTPWASRWTFDLAHELAHVARHLEQSATGIVELGDISPTAAEDDDDEEEANDFAGALLLGDPESLAQELAQRTERRLPRLKTEVVKIAQKRRVEVDALANYLAYRLDLEGQDWWSTAARLQDNTGSAPKLAREALLQHIDLDSLVEEDARLVEMALSWRKT